MTRLRYPAALVFALGLGFAFSSDFSALMLGYVGLYALVAVGLVMLTGIGGMTSFGQAAFVGLGAYATALASTRPEVAAALGLSAQSAWLPWLGLLLGLLVSVTVAFVLGKVTTGLGGHYLPLGTIAWGVSLYMVFGNLELLGGHTGLTGLPPIAVGSVELRSPQAVGVLIWGVLLLALLALTNLLDSREGRAIRTLKSARVMAESMGVDTSKQRLRLFVLAAILACLSGWLYAHLQRFVSPTPFGLNMGVEYLFMAVIGGAGHLWGAVLGAAIVTVAKHELQDLLPAVLGASGNFETVVFGVLMLLVLQRYPVGIWGAIAHRVRAHSVEHRPNVESEANLPGRKPVKADTVVLQATGVTRRFGGLIANDSVSLELRAGQIHALIGPNGAGKSTLFNLLSGVDDPTSGQVELLGQSMQGKSARDFALAGLSRTFQHVHLLGDRSLLENVALGGYLRGSKSWFAAMLRQDRAEEGALVADAQWQLKRCGLEMPGAMAGNLPLGSQRLLEIARALAAHPHALLLDEPAAGLRLEEKRRLAHLLKALRQEGMAILIVEHDMDFVMDIADEVTVLSFGTVISRGRPQAVQADPVVREAYLGADDGGDEHV